MQDNNLNLYTTFSPEKQKLNDSKGSIYIDSSGSTSGSIMKKQVDIVKKFTENLKINEYVDWNTRAISYGTKLPSNIRSDGGTDPNCFLQFWGKEELGIIFTDGQIDQNTMSKFKNNLTTKGCNIPIIIVFTIQSFESKTLKDLEVTINMSIPEAFLSLSNDVLILLSDGNSVKNLMSKGIFLEHIPNPRLDDFLYIKLLDTFNFDIISKIMVEKGIPPNLIKVPNLENNYFDINDLSKIDNLDNIELLELLSSRTMLPKVDLGTFHNVLDKLIQKCNVNPELDAIRLKLYETATNIELVGTQYHKDLINEYNQVRQSSKTQTNKTLMNKINKMKEIINEYQRNTTSFTYGSNRAMKATNITNDILENVGECAQVECPIFITEGDGYIVFKYPYDNNFIQTYTSDYYLESPFELGMELIKWATPGVYCKEMVERMTTNPYTKEKIIGWIPLTSDPGVAMRHLSKIFGGKKELWHFTRAYCGFLVLLAEKHWMADHKENIKNTLIKLTKKYSVSEDLKASNNKVSLYNSLEYVTTNYSICLRDRFYNDIQIICKIIDFIRPDYVYPKSKIQSMSEIIRSFDKMLRLYKQDEPMIDYVMEVDEYGHYVSSIKGTDGLISQLLWYDISGSYKLLKLQMAINKSFSDKKFGKAIKQAFNGESWDDSILNCALPELEGLELKYDSWGPNGIDELKCGYTGMVFSSSKEKLDHIKKLLGQYFFNGHFAVKCAINELGKTASDKDIFACAKKRLYKSYGEQFKVLHTQRAKNRMLYFIQKMKSI